MPVWHSTTSDFPSSTSDTSENCMRRLIRYCLFFWQVSRVLSPTEMANLGCAGALLSFSPIFFRCGSRKKRISVVLDLGSKSFLQSVRSAWPFLRRMGNGKIESQVTGAEIEQETKGARKRNESFFWLKLNGKLHSLFTTWGLYRSRAVTQL